MTDRTEDLLCTLAAEVGVREARRLAVQRALDAGEGSIAVAARLTADAHVLAASPASSASLERGEKSHHGRGGVSPGSSELTVVCAWCGEVLREGDPSGLISHGICDACAAPLLAGSARVTGEVEASHGDWAAAPSRAEQYGDAA